MDITLKFIILGDSNVGKTSLLLKYTDNYFVDSHVATIGIDYKIKIIIFIFIDIYKQKE